MAADYEVGVTALRSASKAMLVIGNNIANANTEGYSKQRAILATQPPIKDDIGLRGAGVRLDRVERAAAEHLNSRIVEKQSAFSQEEIKGERLTDLEGVFNEPSDFGIKNAVSSFFDSMQEVSKNPENKAVRIQMVERANAMTNRFNLMASDMNSMLANVRSDVKTIVTEVNILSGRVADLNGKISALSVGGFTAHDLEDQRDSILVDMSKLIKIDVTLSGDGYTKNVAFSGRELVSGSVFARIDTNTGPSGDIGVIFKTDSVSAAAGGGELNGLLEFQTFANTSKGRLDVLASDMVSQFNRVHSEGVGLNGSFSVVTGGNVVDDVNNPLNNAGLDFPPNDGKLFFTVRNTTGPVVKNSIDVLATDSLTDIVNKINANPALVNLTASITTDKLKIAADAGFTFDFSTSLDPNPPNLGASTVSMDGVYTGSKNDVYSFTVVGGTGGADTIGVTPGLKLRVTDSGGTFTREFNIGVDPAANNEAYSVGDTINVGDGIKLILNAGNVTNGDNFTANVLIDPDESNILSSLGVNSFFTGNKSDNMAVLSTIRDNGSFIAASGSDSIGDNSNAIRLLELKSKAIISGRTIDEHLTETVTLVGLELEENKRTLEAEKGVLSSLSSLKEQSVGVSIDEELASMLSMERLYNASAKFISTLNATLDRLLQI